MTVRDLGKAIGGAILERLGRASSRFQEETPIPVDVLESDDEYLVVFDAPGVTSSDVQVSYRDQTVVVRIDRFREFHEGYEMRFPGRGLQLDGNAKLPEDAVVDPSEARAELKDDGTLYVFLPKAEAENEDEAAEGEAEDELVEDEPVENGTDSESVGSEGGSEDSPTEKNA